MLDEPIVVCPPDKCSDETIQRILDLICDGGAIPASRDTIEKRVLGAKSVVYLKRDGEIVGIAALKVPVQSYRDRIGEETGFPIPEQRFPYELGYVVVDASAQGQNLSPKLVDAVLDVAGGKGLFATTSSAAMHKILPRAGFVKGGEDYEKDDAEKLTLYVRE